MSLLGPKIILFWVETVSIFDQDEEILQFFKLASHEYTPISSISHFQNTRRSMLNYRGKKTFTHLIVLLLLGLENVLTNEFRPRPILYILSKHFQIDWIIVFFNTHMFKQTWNPQNYRYSCKFMFENVYRIRDFSFTFIIHVSSFKCTNFARLMIEYNN